MTLQQLTYIKMTAECGNITEAAEKLFISQPSLSAAIHNLEKEMGVTILSGPKGCSPYQGRGRTAVLCGNAVGTGGYYEGAFRRRKSADAQVFCFLPALFLCSQCLCRCGPDL